MTRVTVWHDGGCPLCRREIALIRHLDWRGAICFIDATENVTVCPIDRNALIARFHAEEDGVTVSGAAAFCRNVAGDSAAPPLGPGGAAADDIGAARMGYRLFLRLRPELQRFAARRLPV